jgi:hypothetical protein
LRAVSGTERVAVVRKVQSCRSRRRSCGITYFRIGVFLGRSGQEHPARENISFPRLAATELDSERSGLRQKSLAQRGKSRSPPAPMVALISSGLQPHSKESTKAPHLRNHS